MLLPQCRRLVDTYVPSAGRLFRVLRDALFEDRPIETSYGFTLAGGRRMGRAEWEPEETKAFLNLLADHDVVVDVGANIGFYSCLAAIRGKHVLSIEPSRRNLRFLYQNLWENRCTTTEVFPMGLAAQSGLQCMRGFGGIASFVPGWGQSERSPVEIVPTTTLDTILDGRFDGQRLLLKIDVEGFELEVLKGAINTLQRHPRPTWLVEIVLSNSLIPGGINHLFAETFELFWNCGYECRALDWERSIVTPAHIGAWINNGLRPAEHDYLFLASHVHNC